MKKRQVLWAVMFGAMLAVTGCGDDPDPEDLDPILGTGGTAGTGGAAGTGGTAGTGGGSGSDYCSTLCNACAMDQMAECASACQQQIDALGGFVDLDRCPNELNALGTCLGDNGCDTNLCDDEYSAWASCLVGFPI